MLIIARTALTAAAAIVSLVAVAATDAAETAPEPTRLILPADVVETADAESALTIIPAIAPEGDDQADQETLSLRQLVARHGSPEAASVEDHCLAVAVFFEAKSEPLEGQLAVAHTVLNRARSGRFASTICGVVKQPSQFSFVRAGRMPSVPSSRSEWRTAVAIAHIARQDMWRDGISNALFFHARHVSPGWKLKRIAAVGNHIFYR